MSIHKTLIAVAVTGFASTATWADGGAVSIYNNHPEASAAGPAYWTPERIANAKPMTIGKVKGEALPSSYGSSVLDFTRTRISPQSANKAAPYRSIGKLYFTIPTQGDFQCSASVIANRLIVTAAHCMYSAGIGFHTNWVFIPGFDGTQSTLATQRPYGSWDWAYGTVPGNWLSTNGALPNNTDFGLLQLVDQSFDGVKTVTVAKKVGKLTTAIGHLFDTHVSILGYPCNFDSCNIMQRVDSGDHRPASTAAGNNAYEYGSDMTGGSSGGPWIENFGDPKAAAPTGGYATRNAVVGVTSYIYNDAAILIEGASQFNADFSTLLSNACANAAGNC